MLSKNTRILLTLLFLLAAFAWTRNRTRHFIGHHDWDNVTWVTAAENYERYGLLNTRFQQIINAYPVPKDEWTAYSNHPPGISLITLAGRNLFGTSEFAARLPPIFVTLLAAALLFHLSRKIYDEKTALLALFFFILMPITVYYSAKIGHEQFTLPLIFLMLILYRRWLMKPTSGLLFIMAIVAVIGGWISWAWYLSLGMLALHTWWWHRNFFAIFRLWPVWIGAALSLVALVGVNFWYDSNYLRHMQEVFLFRTANEGSDKSISLVQWMTVAGATFLWQPTPVVTIMALYSLRKSLKRFDKPFKSLLVIAFATGLAYALIFWQGTYTHDYYIYYFTAILPVPAAVGYQSLLYKYSNNPPKTWKYLLGILLILFVVGSIRWSVSLYTEDTGEQRYTWGIKAGEQTEPGEVIASNLPDFGPHIGYYARRRVVYNVDVQKVTPENRPEKWGFFIYCPKEGESLAWIEEYPSEYDRVAECYLVDLH